MSDSLQILFFAQGAMIILAAAISYRRGWRQGANDAGDVLLGKIIDEGYMSKAQVEYLFDCEVTIDDGKE
jgi:hypothetical protein